MRRPDIVRMVRARADIDEHLNKVLVLLTAPPDAPIENVEIADPIITAQVKLARSALREFEDACHA